MSTVEMTEKEIVMDVKAGGRKSRRRRRTAKAAAEEGSDMTVVTKDPAHPTIVTPAGPPIVALSLAHAHSKSQKGGVALATTATAPAAATAAATATAPKIVLSPPKKKPAKILLVPKGPTAVRVPKVLHKKTFKAKQVAVTIDNTATTRKHRKSVMAKIDEMTEDQLRAAAVAARLSRRETVAKVPVGLLRQMVKDVQTMKASLL